MTIYVRVIASGNEVGSIDDEGDVCPLEALLGLQAGDEALVRPVVRQGDVTDPQGGHSPRELVREELRAVGELQDLHVCVVVSVVRVEVDVAHPLQGVGGVRPQLGAGPLHGERRQVRGRVTVTRQSHVTPDMSDDRLRGPDHAQLTCTEVRSGIIPSLLGHAATVTAAAQGQTDGNVAVNLCIQPL